MRLLEVHVLEEIELEKTSDRYDTLWALICWFFTNDHFDLLFVKMITLSLFGFKFLLLFD